MWSTWVEILAVTSSQTVGVRAAAVTAVIRRLGRLSHSESYRRTLIRLLQAAGLKHAQTFPAPASIVNNEHLGQK